ncbi:MAG: HAD family hydrolase [Acidobacteria bacterium]|nr:MAG: HAD family hydrolase [Acidobacteriota bacterium]
MQRLLVQAVLFDAVGTLFHLRAPVGEIYLEQARRYGFEASDPELPVKLTRSFRAAFRAQGPLAFPDAPVDRIQELERAWWRSVVFRTFAPFGHPPDFENFFEHVFEMFRTGEAWRLDLDVRLVLPALRDKGLKIGLVTNYDSRVLDVLVALGIRSLFDCVTISTLAGAAKPDPRIFAEACAALSSLPSDACHIGDDPEEDWEGARQTGMHAILYDPSARYRDLDVPRLSRLADLLRILL